MLWLGSAFALILNIFSTTSPTANQKARIVYFEEQAPKEFHCQAPEKLDQKELLKQAGGERWMPTHWVCGQLESAVEGDRGCYIYLTLGSGSLLGRLAEHGL